jgi:hypothetical protein
LACPQDGNVGVGVFPEGEEVFSGVSRNKESRFVSQRGWPEFEALLEEANFDLFDLHHPSIM